MSLTLIFSSFFAGILTIFSPCILPMVPFVVRSSLQKSKWGPVLLALGVALSFSIATYTIATSGKIIGLTPDNLKIMSGVFLLIASILFMSPKAITKLSMALSPISSKLQSSGANNTDKKPYVFMEFINGLMLGPIWAPCSGPTLAIIIGIVINQPDAKYSMILLAIFSIGSILPILFISYGTKSLVSKVQSKALQNSGRIKKILGIFCAIMAILILTGLDKKLEIMLLTLIPDFITNLSLAI